MQLRTKCPGCQKTLRCPTERIGTMVRCPACRHKFRLESLASGGDASLDAQPSMEAMQTIEQPPAGPAAAEPQSPEHTSGSRGSNESQSSRSRSSRSQASRSVSKGGQKRAAVASLPSLGRFGNYDLKAVLGKGGFGVVYRAWDETLGRQVAIKIPRFDLGAERKVKRFRQEARAAAKLQHPNIVGIIAEGVENRRPYIVAEFVDGQPLSKTIEQSRPTHRQAAQWVRDLAGALHYAHQQGIVHRDIKPDNVMLDQDQRPRLMDFGLAKQLDEDSSLSVDGSVLGTPNYMAPEQARGEISEVDGRSDQYSLGVVLYELLTGEKPFSGPPHAVLAKVADANFEPPTPRSHDATISKDLEAICLRAISKNADQRYPDMQALADDLDRWLEGKPTDARPLGPYEKAVRWCRRNPALAGSGAAISLGLLIIVGLVWKLATGEPAQVIVQAEPAVTSDSSVNAPETPVDAPDSNNTTDPSESLISSVPDPPAVPLAPPAPPWQPTPEQQAFFDEVAALPVEEQASAVARKLQEVNPGYDGELNSNITDKSVYRFEVTSNEITDIWPVRALHSLRILRCSGTSQKGKLENLRPLAGIPLEELYVGKNRIRDLKPLAGMQLTRIDFNSNLVDDLTPLHGMPLLYVQAFRNPYEDLKPIARRGLPHLNCATTNVVDLTPLQHCRIESLGLSGTLVTSLKGIEGSPITKLVCDATAISDFGPLLTLSLTELRIKPLLFHLPEEELIRKLPLSVLATTWAETSSPDEFWEQIHSLRSAAVLFAESTSVLSHEEQHVHVESKLNALNNTDQIKCTVSNTTAGIQSAVLQLTPETEDISPVRAFKGLKSLTIGQGVPWLDLSAINCLPIEELICRQSQALRNRYMLAEIQTLNSINGQPADQYLSYLETLSESQADETPIKIPTEEETLAAHPPLDEWLQGREILTVAQDGSAMFTSIQAALDAQQDGQVVQVLDKGPYRESLRWDNKIDCGLVTRSDTVILDREFLQPDDREQPLGSWEAHHFRYLQDCRLHGFVFVGKTVPQEQKRYWHGNPTLHCEGLDGFCWENCVLVCAEFDAGEHALPIISFKSHATSPGRLVCMRNNVFGIHHVFFDVSKSFRLAVQQNWFRALTGLSNQPSGPMIMLTDSNAEPVVALISANLIDRQCVGSNWFKAHHGSLEIEYRNNSVIAETGTVMVVSARPGERFVIEDNLNMVERHQCYFYGEVTEVFLPDARLIWSINRNYSNGVSSRTINRLPLGPSHLTEIRLLSIDPLHRNFMRVDPASIQVPDGDPFPGALPPGPAPPEGDWFTRLQERFEEALQYIPEAEREKWTRPIELPKFTPPTANVAEVNNSNQAKPNEREPMQPAVVPQPIAPEDAEPAVGLRLDGRNSSFVEYDSPQPRRWVELDAQGKLKYTFEELERTDRYVMIIDRSRKMKIRLPVGNGRVYYSVGEDENWLMLGTFRVPLSEEELAAQQREQEPMAANAAVANNEVAAANGQAAPAADVAQPAGVNEDRFDRSQLPKEMRDLLRLPGMDEKMKLLERDYLYYKRGFFVYGQITSQNTSIDPRLIDARMPVGPGGYFIDLVAEGGRPIGFVLHGHAYKSVIPIGPPDGHEGVFAENLGKLVMTPLRASETQKTDLYVRRLDVRGRSQPIAVDFKITTRVPELNYPTDRIVRRGAGDVPGFVIQGKTLANGKFSLTGLSPKPTEYFLEIRLPGHLPIEQTLRLDSSLESVVVEEKIPIRIETIPWKNGKFELDNLKQAWLSGGDQWRFDMPKPKPVPPGTAMMGGWVGMGGMGGASPFYLGRGGMILQSGGKLSFQIEGTTTSAKDLGEGALGEFLNSNPMRDLGYFERNFDIKPGHVYLIRSYHRGSGMAPAKPDVELELRQSDYVLVRVTLE